MWAYYALLCLQDMMEVIAQSEVGCRRTPSSCFSYIPAGKVGIPLVHLSFQAFCFNMSETRNVSLSGAVLEFPIPGLQTAPTGGIFRPAHTFSSELFRCSFLDSAYNHAFVVNKLLEAVISKGCLF